MNIYQMADPQIGSETLVTLYQSSTLKIEAIRSRLIKEGEMYDQKEDEWVLLVQGTAELEIEGSLRHLCAGESLFLPAHTRHRLLSTSDDALWLCLFSS